MCFTCRQKASVAYSVTSFVSVGVVVSAFELAIGRTSGNVGGRSSVSIIRVVDDVVAFDATFPFVSRLGADGHDW